MTARIRYQIGPAAATLATVAGLLYVHAVFTWGWYSVRAIQFVTALVVFAVCGTARAEDTAIGFVKYIHGDAVAIRNGQRVTLALSSPVQEHDQLETGGYSELGVTFRDDTRISMGPGTRLDINTFTFRPAEKRYGLVFRVLIGSLQYMSGIIAKIAPASVSISTPQFTIAVRGTRLLIRAENQ